VTVRLAIAGTLVAVATGLIGCDGCEPGEPVPVRYPPPIDGPPRPQEGATSRRWSGPCWRDVASPHDGDERVEASTSFDYDDAGFVTHLEHRVRTPHGVATTDKQLRRLDGGAIVDEHRKLGGGSVDIRYRFITGTEEESHLDAPVFLEPREEPTLCLCPAEDRGICYLGEQVFCRSLGGEIVTDVGARAFSCIACGDRIRVDKTGRHQRASFASKTLFTKIEGGMEVRTSLQHVGEEPLRYRADSEARSLKDSCALDSRRCTFDDHGNLLEVQRFGDDGHLERREVMSYACREARRAR